MTDETQLKIYGLVDVAEQQQAELSAAINALKAEREALRAELSATVRQSLAGASQTAANALETATAPILNRLTDVTTAAAQAEGKLRDAGAWFAWKWVAVAAGGLAGVCLVAYGSLWWQIHQIESLSEQKAELEANVALLEKRGGKIKIQTCGGRICIEASTNQGKGNIDWSGTWQTQDGTPMVIPRGY